MEPKNIKVNYHRPDARLTQYLSDLSHLLEDKEGSQLRGKKLDDDLKSRTKSVANKKVEILDEIIFPSIANLTYFFDALAKEPELQERFNSDIKDLFGIRRLNPKAFNYAFMFTSLIEGMIHLSGKEGDFRLRLIHKLQEIIFRKLQHVEGKDASYILETKDATYRIFEDIQRVMVWTAMLSHRVKDEYDLKGLVSKDNKKKKKAEQEAKKNSPKRTFD